MATLDLDTNPAKYQIRAYQPGWIRVNEQTLTNSLIITPDQLSPWAPQSIQAVQADAFQHIITLHPDILLIGTGSTPYFLSLEIYGHLINQGIGVEVMDTRSACYTFNALSAEGRKVAAALIL